MITLERGGNGCDIATIRSPLAFRCTSVGMEGGGKNIGGRNSKSDITSIGKKRMRYLYIKNECLKYERLVFFDHLTFMRYLSG